MKKILFYDDAPGFGGHEVTVVDAIKYIINSHPDIEVSFIYWEENKRLEERLELLKKEGGHIETYPYHYQWKGLWVNIKELFFSPEIKKLTDLLQRINPDVVIAVQGTIHISSLCVMASRKCDYKTLSFIPMAHPMRVTGIRSSLMNIITRYLYRQPSAFITISETAKQQLINWGVDAQINQAFYGLDISKYEIQDKIEARQALGLGEQEYVIALIGRIQFCHKAQDFLVKTISYYRKTVKNNKWLIVGDGPDGDDLKLMINQAKLEDYVKIIPWRDNLSTIYSAIDMLIIPSRLEGRPIVMLEAMYYEIPIVASNIDGMAELLPKEWLFDVGDSSSMVETIMRVKNNDNTGLILQNKHKILNKLTLDNYGQSFYKAIT